MKTSDLTAVNDNSCGMFGTPGLTLSASGENYGTVFLLTLFMDRMSEINMVYSELTSDQNPNRRTLFSLS